MSEAEELKNEIKTFLRSKGMTGDLNTLRYKPTLEEGTIVDWFAEFYHHKMREVLEEVKTIEEIEKLSEQFAQKEMPSNYTTQSDFLDFERNKNEYLLEYFSGLLNHFKTKIKEG